MPLSEKRDTIIYGNCLMCKATPTKLVFCSEITISAFVQKQDRTKGCLQPYWKCSSIQYVSLLYWYLLWNSRIFPFTKKSYLHRAQWRYYFYLSRVRILVSPWLLTLILTFWNRKYKYYCLYFSFITLYPSFITFLWQVFCDRWPL